MFKKDEHVILRSPVESLLEDFRCGFMYDMERWIDREAVVICDATEDGLTSVEKDQAYKVRLDDNEENREYFETLEYGSKEDTWYWDARYMDPIQPEVESLSTEIFLDTLLG